MIIIVYSIQYYTQFDMFFLEDTGTVINKEEQYQVIDECMEVETSETAQDSPAEVISEITTCPKSDSTTKQDLKTGKI